jgi:hypothetical protein
MVTQLGETMPPKRTLQIVVGAVCLTIIAVLLVMAGSPLPAFDRAGGVTLATFDGVRYDGEVHARLVRYPNIDEARAGLATIGFKPLPSSSAAGPQQAELLQESTYALYDTLPPLPQQGVWYHMASLYHLLTPNGIRRIRRLYEYEGNHPFNVDMKLPDDLRVGECIVLIQSSKMGKGDATLMEQEMEQEKTALREHQMKVSKELEAKRKALPMEPLRYTLVTTEDERLLDEKDILSLDIQFTHEKATTEVAVVTVQLPAPMIEALRQNRTKYPNHVYALGAIVVNDLLVLHFGMNEINPQSDRMVASLSSRRGDSEDEVRRIITILMRKQLREKHCLDPQGLIYGVTEAAPEHWTLTTGPDRLQLSYQHGKATYTLRVLPKPCAKPVVKQVLDEIASGMTWGKQDQQNEHTAIWMERLPNAANGASGAVQRFAGVVCRGAGPGAWGGQPGERTEVHTWDVELKDMPAEFPEHYEAARRFISSIATTYGKVRAVEACYIPLNEP